jgi:hypothetical protein
MATKKETPATEHKSRIILNTADLNETDEFFGTPLRTGQIQTNTEVEVPKDMREVFDLKRMQEHSVKNRIENLRLKEDKG